MNIGIDARSIDDARKTGIGVCGTSFINALSRIDNQKEYLVSVVDNPLTEKETKKLAMNIKRQKPYGQEEWQIIINQEARTGIHHVLRGKT